MNLVQIIGRTTQQLELKQTKTGLNYIHFTLAQKENKDITNFIPCVAWKETAENIAKWVKRGDMLAISGKVLVKQIINKENQKQMFIDINVDKFYLLPNERKPQVTSHNDCKTMEYSGVVSKENKNINNNDNFDIDAMQFKFVDTSK